MRLFKTILLAFMCIVLTVNVSSAKEKKGILLVSFGTSVKKAQRSFDNIEKEVRKSFPNTKIYWAFTSKFIRYKLLKRGKKVMSPSEALAMMGEKGYTHVAVQSLHMIPGLEYDNLLKTVDAFNNMPKGTKVVLCGKPLMYKHSDMILFSKKILDINTEALNKYDAIVYMGHGTHHSSNIYYSGLQYYFSNNSNKLFIATVEGFPVLDDVVYRLEKIKAKKVLLIPLMTVAGDHAINDMAGNAKDSWKSILESKGYKVDCLLKGLAEYDELVEIWIKHLKKVYSEL
jgi:sirohydrochlorin cobaltochelatase